MGEMIEAADSRAAERQLVRILSLLGGHKARLPVLLGAGASAGAGLPIGTSLALQMYRAMYPFDSQSATPDFEAVMSLVGGGMDAMADGLRVQLQTFAPSLAHRQLARLVGEGRLGPEVFTTNFDSVMEAAFKAEGIDDVRVIYNPADLKESCAQSPTIFKVHGGLEQPSSLRCTPELVAKTSGMTKLLASVCHERGLLIIGHRLRDPGINEDLLASEPTNQLVIDVNPSPLGAEGRSVLARHGSSENVVHVPFGDFMARLTLDVSTYSAYDELEDELTALWTTLDSLRESAQEGRYNKLRSLAEAGKTRASERGLDEFAAVQYLADYELSQYCDPWVLTQALVILDRLFAARFRLANEARHRIEARYVSEMNRYLFQGFNVGTVMGELSKMDRVSSATELVGKLEGSLPHSNPTGWSFSEASLACHLGEMLKEVHALDAQPGTVDVRLDAARQLLQSASKGDFPGIVARATYHLAIVNEYAARQPASEIEKRRSNELWQELSRQAERLASDQSMDRLAAMALMNWATASHAIRDLYGDDRALRGQDDGVILEKMVEAIRTFSQVADARNSAWAHLQLASVYERLANRQHTQRADHTVQMYRNALAARAWGIRVVTDPIVQGFGDYYAARALSDLTAMQELVYDTRREQIQKIIALSTAGLEKLRQTHARSQAANCSVIRAQARTWLAAEADEIREQLLSQALKDQADALETLAGNKQLDIAAIESRVAEIGAMLKESLSRMAL